MGLLVTTDEKGVMIFANEKEKQDGTKYTLYSIPISKKDDNGKWESSYISCSFKKGVEVANKAKIKINSAFPTFNSYNGKKYNKLVIMEFDVIEEGETTDKDGFIDMSNIKDDELPFAD